MVANLGYGTLIITFLVSIYGAVAAYIGARRNSHALVDSARNAMLLTFPLISVTALSITFLLINGNYEVQYVTEVSSNSMPIYLRITALWGGQAGSLIFWSWLLSAFASAVTLRKWDRDREFLPWVILVCLVTLAFFLSLSIFVNNPFVSFWQFPTGNVTTAMVQPAGTTLFVPQEGNGLNPLLRHPGMIFHPPMLYLGFVAFVIPYAFAMAALITKRADARWIHLSRRWTIVAWLFLSLGLVLGMRWAYDVLGWGGYWGWDPVENAAFMPWLVGTAFLHSVIVQEKRGMLKQWNMVLIILTYSLVILGTFLTRSGVLSSVHAFAQSAIGPMFFAFIAITFFTSMTLVITRWDSLKSENELSSMFSREALFLLNNLLFFSLLIIIFWGVMYPVISEALGIVGQGIPALAAIFTGQKVTVGPQWYEAIVWLPFAGLLLLMGIAPLSTWQYSTIKTIGRAMWKPLVASLLVVAVVFLVGYHSIPALIGFWLCALVASVTIYEFWRAAWARHNVREENIFVALWYLVGKNRRRYGGYIVHLGMVLMAIGIIGIELFQSETQGTIPQGGELNLGKYTIKYDSLSVFDTADGRNVARAVVSIYDDGKFVGERYPRRDYYSESQQNMTIAGVRTTPEDDIYVILVDWQPVSTSAATFKVYHNPLVMWLWIGSIVLILGSVVAAWPSREPEMVAVSRSVPVDGKAKKP